MSFEGPPQPNAERNPTVKEVFDDMKGGLKESYKRAGVRYAVRTNCAEAGFPLKKSDDKPDKMSRNRSEAVTFLTAYTGKDIKTLVKESEDYVLPELEDMVRKSPENDRVLVKLDELDRYKLALALAPVGKDGLRDFRKAKDIRIELDSSGRIYIGTEMGMPIEQYTYNPGKFIVSTYTEDRDPDIGQEYTVQSYAHVDSENKLKSKSLLIFNDEQRTKVRDFIKEYIDENL